MRINQNRYIKINNKMTRKPLEVKPDIYLRNDADKTHSLQAVCGMLGLIYHSSGKISCYPMSKRTDLFWSPQKQLKFLNLITLCHTLINCNNRLTRATLIDVTITELAHIESYYQLDNHQHLKYLADMAMHLHNIVAHRAKPQKNFTKSAQSIINFLQQQLKTSKFSGIINSVDTYLNCDLISITHPNSGRFIPYHSDKAANKQLYTRYLPAIKRHTDTPHQANSLTRLLALSPFSHPQNYIPIIQGFPQLLPNQTLRLLQDNNQFGFPLTQENYHDRLTQLKKRQQKTQKQRRTFLAPYTRRINTHIIAAQEPLLKLSSKAILRLQQLFNLACQLQRQLANNQANPNLNKGAITKLSNALINFCNKYYTDALPSYNNMLTT